MYFIYIFLFSNTCTCLINTVINIYLVSKLLSMFLMPRKSQKENVITVVSFNIIYELYICAELKYCLFFKLTK